MSDRTVFRHNDDVQLVLLEEKQDISTLTKFFNDQDVTRGIFTTTPVYKQEVEKMIKNSRENKETRPLFGIEVEDGKLIGVTRMIIDMTDNTAEIEILIGEKKYRGQGYGTSAMMLFLQYGFLDCGLKIIYAKIFSSNNASKKLCKKCGFEEAARLKNAHLNRGTRVDEVIMGVREKEWRSAFSD